jgi:DNA polymerase-3 subunit beta
MSCDNPTNSFSLLSDNLKNIIDKTKFAISTEETRYYLNGIFIHEKEGKFIAVATDGHRLAKFVIDAPANAKDMAGVIIPRKTVLEVRKLLEETENEVELQFSDNKVVFVFDNIKLTSKLIDGTYPDYEKVIPTNNDKEASFDAKLFANLVDRVSTVASDKTSAVSLHLTKDLMEISINAPDCGSANDELAINYSDDDMQIGFNSRYLIEVASQIEDKDCTFVLSDSASPALIKDAKNPDAVYVLMPMRT